MERALDRQAQKPRFGKAKKAAGGERDEADEGQQKDAVKAPGRRRRNPIGGGRWECRPGEQPVAEIEGKTRNRGDGDRRLAIGLENNAHSVSIDLCYGQGVEQKNPCAQENEAGPTLAQSAEKAKPTCDEQGQCDAHGDCPSPTSEG
jgi:hypothetical protein